MSRRTVAAAAIAIGGLLITPQVLPASAATPGSGERASALALADPHPPAGKAWLVGVVTDQAGHPLQDVTVEAWLADDTEPTEPTASDLTYENVLAGDQEGYFRLEVPIHAEYLIVISRATDDAFRTFQYHDGQPIKVGLHKVRKLGTSEIARTALQPSKVTAKISPTKVNAGKKTKLTVTVTCTNVAPVTGTFNVTIDGKQVKFKKPVHLSNGKAVADLTAPKKRGTYDVVVSYSGDSYVKKSAKKLTLTVKK
jgi:hypothetical protein